MKCVGLFFLVLSLQSLLILRQYEVSLKRDYFKIATEQAQAKSEDFRSILEKAENFEDMQSDFTSDLYGIPIPEVTVTLNDFAVNLESSFSSLETTLVDLIHSTSSSLASASNKLSSMLHNFTKSAESFADAFSFLNNDLSGAFSSIQETVTNLKLGTSITGAVLAIGESLMIVLQIVNGADQSQFNVTQEFDDAAFSVGIKLQVLVVAITTIAEAAASKIATIKEEVKEIVVALTLVLHTVLLIVQSICYSIGVVLSASLVESATLNSLLLITDGALTLITSVVESITNDVTTKMSLVVGIISFTLTSLNSKFNASMDKLESRTLLKMTNTLGSIFYKLVGSSGKLVDSISSSVSTITSSLRIVSASDSGLHSKVCRQLHKIFSSLLQLTGSDNEIITNLSKQLPSIFDIIKSVASSLISGLETEATGGVGKAIADILDSLIRILPFLNVELGHIKIQNIEFATKEIAKNVQILTSIVSTIVSAVSGGIDTVTTIVFECVIALQFLHSTILYVVQSVSAVVASFLLTKSSSLNELASSLAVVFVAMLNRVAKAVSMVAASLPDGLLYVVKSTAAFLIEVCKKGCEALSKVSLVETKVKITFEQITLGSTGSVSVEGIVNGTVGTLSQIFSGVTGSLGSISSSSSLSSLDSSMKEMKSSESDILQTVSIILISITTKISNIASTASGILSAMSNSLRTVFGNLYDVISKLSILGDISTSLGSSVSKISIALHSIIDASIDAKRNVYVVNEPVANVAKSVQILISFFAAVIKASADASDDVFKSVSEAISAISYVISCVVLLVQHILGAVIASVSLAFGGIPFSLQKLTITMSTILERLVSIATEMTTLVSDGKQAVLRSNILSSVSNLNNKTEASLSPISGITANMKATFRAANQEL